ncbi:MAG: DUF4422 domain-containing protein [Atopobium sp.]|uniref:DUF4422 domain-containing protein n=1 Tax=Atopobium sp. TaxID=1872650 RepID=UPI002A804C1E|nr:DUF4422 domain-containing protein [Atopobium sp.]MDY4523203.1 DUF4422 domain-containing protein [Atopobium sp.]
MALISCVVPAYNVEKYIGRCLTSLKNQTFDDFEVIVVDDASTDATAQEIDKVIYGDNRFVVVRHEENRNLHLARKSGVMAAQGEYIIFVDGDDELADETFERAVERMRKTPCDMLHFGVKVITDDDALPEEYLLHDDNKLDAPRLEGKDIIHKIYDESQGFSVDWRVTQILYSARIVKEAFEEMPDLNLLRAEDSFESLVITSKASSMEFMDEYLGYLYHFGCGIMGTTQINLLDFEKHCKQMAACLAAGKNYAQHYPQSIPQACLDGFIYQNIVFIANEWRDRVAREDKEVAAAILVRNFGKAQINTELWRLVRDRAYDFIAKGTLPEANDILYLYYRVAQDTYTTTDDVTVLNHLHAMQRAAQDHMDQLRSTRKKQEYKAQDLRIFVTTHKRVDFPESPIFQPVQVGGLLKNPESRFMDSFHDDEGDNISSKNPYYCEMTVQYWAWKNAMADYMGFCHYRRYFNFSETEYEENEYGEVMDSFIDATSIAKYGLDSQSARACIEGYDVITTRFQDLRHMPGDFTTPYEQYKAAPLLHIEDIDLLVNIIAELQPEYLNDARAFFTGHESCFCNMYIMRGQIFSDYCAWVFPILEKYCNEAHMEHYSKEALRTPGHLTERLFNIYYRHALRTNAGWKTKQLQCVHFEQPDKTYDLQPIVDVRQDALGKKIVPVVFASDNNYVPMLSTTMFSMLCNANPSNFYDIVVLERNIDGARRETIQKMVADFGNASVRFYNVSRMIRGYDLSTNNEHISLETYYRFLVQEILSFYDKVLYLDSDLIVRGDVSELFDTELGTNLLAAAHDLDYLGNLNMNDGKRMKYTVEELGLVDPYEYFQAGVLVLNTAQMRKLHTVSEWMDIVSEADYIYDDQDILNAECQGRVTYLPFNWNVMHDCGGRVAAVFRFAPNDFFDAYNASRANPKIIHYAGWEKPWVNTRCDYATEYWRYARAMPFYEELISRMISSAVPAEGVPSLPAHEKVVSPDSGLRKLVDPIAPLGSARREVLKSLGRAALGKK